MSFFATANQRGTHFKSFAPLPQVATTDLAKFQLCNWIIIDKALESADSFWTTGSVLAAGVCNGFDLRTNLTTSLDQFS
jgi:hypothetical protein